MAEVAGLRLVYPYVEDPHSSGVYDPDNIVLRPVLEIEMLGPGLTPDDAPPRVAALVDSGAERTFAAPWLARVLSASTCRTHPRSWWASAVRPEGCASPT